MKNILSSLLNYFFPPECLGCEQEDFFLCPDCRAQIPSIIRNSSVQLDHLDRVWIFAEWENKLIQKAIKQLKFRFALQILQDLTPFFEQYAPYASIPDNAVFVPVPLHRFRQYSRGFNQSTLLAQVLSQIAFKQERIVPLLKRIRNTPQQALLSKVERAENLAEAFVITPSKRDVDRETPIILIDDVLTTGNTLIECAKTLRQSGYKYIEAMVMAHGSQ